MHGSPSGDYINANYVTMEIAASGIVNRYIATQGPLSTTTNDFWIMVWETQSPLIVMLTPIYEHGRVKCHPYWPPHVNSPVVYHNLQVTMIQERSLPLWIHREFHIKHLETDEERVVVQLMYQNWPDHGVPDEPLSFIRFMEEVRKLRLGTVEPTIVHCSAGIGRTGVLILMETAECLIEANQPVYPLDIVTQMRLQRPLMIQTPSQYRFVCECVLNVYQKGMIRPLPEFSSSVQGNSPPSSAAQQQQQQHQLLSNNSSSDCRSRSHNFCSSTNTTSWFHNNLHQQQLHAGINA